MAIVKWRVFKKKHSRHVKTLRLLLKRSMAYTDQERWYTEKELTNLDEAYVQFRITQKRWWSRGRRKG
jgi:hypothetical protein